MKKHYKNETKDKRFCEPIWVWKNMSEIKNTLWVEKYQRQHLA